MQDNNKKMHMFKIYQLNTSHQLQQIPLVSLQNSPTPSIQQTKDVRQYYSLQYNHHQLTIITCL